MGSGVGGHGSHDGRGEKSTVCGHGTAELHCSATVNADIRRPALGSTIGSSNSRAVSIVQVYGLTELLRRGLLLVAVGLAPESSNALTIKTPSSLLQQTNSRTCE